MLQFATLQQIVCFDLEIGICCPFWIEVLFIESMIRIQCRQDIEQPRELRHPTLSGDQALALIVELAHDLLVDLLDYYSPLRWPWAWTRLQLQVARAVHLVSGHGQHDLLGEPVDRIEVRNIENVTYQWLPFAGKYQPFLTSTSCRSSRVKSSSIAFT